YNDLVVFFKYLPNMKLENLTFFGDLDINSTKELIRTLPKSNLRQLSLEKISVELFPKFLEALSQSPKDLTIRGMDYAEFCRIVSENIHFLTVKKLRSPYSRTATGLPLLFPNYQNVIWKSWMFSITNLVLKECKLWKDTKIKKLNLMRCFQGDEALKCLSRSLKGSNVKELSIEWLRAADSLVEFIEISDEAMTDFILSNGQHLECLRINIKEYNPKVKLLSQLASKFENLTIDFDFGMYK
ncbi:hypothetical protein HDV01_004288, partial [Terramyces sp. JEL0728]